MSKLLIGIDIGGTNIKFGCFNSDLKLIQKASITTGADMGAEDVVQRLVEGIEQLVKDCGAILADVRAAGIGTAGPADYQAGILLNPVNMPGLKNAPLKQLVQSGLGCSIAFDNDANVACYGEFTVGAGQDVNDMVFFTLGTGIGCGIVADGKLIQGVYGNGAEVGHMIIFPDGERCNCGQRGCVEAHASASHTARRATEAVLHGTTSSLQVVLENKGEITSKDVYEHLAKGDALAEQITNDTARALALVCINMLHTTEPARIVFAGGMIAAGDVLLSRIRHYFDELIWTIKKETVEIVFASLSEDAGIIGAAALARDMT
ncbi:ROK family protein [Planctomycetota bacterium]